VTAPTPARLLLDGHCLIVLEHTLQAAAPEEACALLLGSQQQETLQVLWIWPCCNVWQPAAERHRRFSLDPREQLLAQRWSRSRRLQVLGAAHSHPSSAAVPSSTDRQLCIGPTLMLIRSGLDQGLPALRAWWMPENGGESDAPDLPQELPIELLPAATGARHLGE
jgi:proteasome lid subunit RPN8/RPN11